MKTLFIKLFLLITTFCFSQRQQFTIHKNDGDKYITNKYSEKKDGIKFKTENGDFKNVKWPQLDKIVSSGKKEKDNYTLKYIKFNGNGALMEEMISGTWSLYKQENRVPIRVDSNELNTNGIGTPNTRTIASNTIEWYVVKEGEAKAHYLKGNNLAYGSFKENAIKYFEDCEILVKKIEEKDFKRKDVAEMVEFYNENCGKN